MSDKLSQLDAAARSLQQLQTCAKNTLTEKTWLKARVWSVALCVAFGVTLIALCVYCALLLQSNNRALHRLRETCPILKDPESTP